MARYMVAGRPMGAGPDVSMYQPGANPVGEDFTIVKFTEGIGYLDPWATRHAATARSSGKPWTAYHFARPGNDPTREADWFCDMLERIPGWNRAPVLDMEQPGTGAWVLTFCRRVLARTGWTPMVYTGAYVPFDRPAELLQFPLWIAAYPWGYSPNPNPEAGQPPACAPWGRAWTLWQYTSSADVPGVPGRCDRSVADVAWLASGTPPPPIPEDDMPYTPEQLTTIITNAVTAAAVFIARDASDGGMYVFCRLTMDRRPLESPEAVTDARTQLGIPFLRGDDPSVSQDISPALVHLFALNKDDGASAVSLDPTELAATVAKAVRQELAGALAG